MEQYTTVVLTVIVIHVSLSQIQWSKVEGVNKYAIPGGKEKQ